MPQWDADLYLKFGSQRGQAVLDLMNRIELKNPRRIADLGCGPGTSTGVLRARWPESFVMGMDSSPEMIGRARQCSFEAEWEIGDAARWRSAEPFDLVFSNALLHWIPDHEKVCPHWLDQVAPGGALAVQVPAHYDSPLHREILEVSREAEWDGRMQKARQALTHHPPAFYYDLLAPRAARLDLWEVIYQHVLPGPEAVLEWFRGTGLRPYLEALSGEEERRRFELLLLERYRATYPRRAEGAVLFPFRRLFFVAYR